MHRYPRVGHADITYMVCNKIDRSIHTKNIVYYETMQKLTILNAILDRVLFSLIFLNSFQYIKYLKCQHQTIYEVSKIHKT